jgi:hypothetical protein
MHMLDGHASWASLLLPCCHELCRNTEGATTSTLWGRNQPEVDDNSAGAGGASCIEDCLSLNGHGAHFPTEIYTRGCH